MITEVARLYFDSAENASKAKDLVKDVKHGKGNKGVRFGEINELKPSCELIVDWESIKYHEEFNTDPKNGIIGQELQKLWTGIDVCHVEFDNDVAFMTSAGQITEHFTIYCNPDISTEDQAKGLANTKEFMSHLRSEAKGIFETACGWGQELMPNPDGSGKAKTMHGLINWTSVEAHLQHRETDSFKNCVDLIRTIPGCQGIKATHAFMFDV